MIVAAVVILDSDRSSRPFDGVIKGHFTPEMFRSLDLFVFGGIGGDEVHSASL